MRVEGNTTLLLIGPGRLESSQYAEVFGAKVRSVTVPEGRVYPIYFLEDSEIEVTGDHILVNGDTIPESWKRFVSKEYGRVFTFGDTDSGKSSFCVYSINRTRITHVIDSDVGQNDIAHPGAMGLGEKKGQVVSLSGLRVVEVAFTGVISPSGFESRCLKAFTHLVRMAGESVIVDTTGWIRGRKARDYKLAKIEVFEPDVIACFGEVPYYLEDYEVFRLDSFVVKKRDRETRVVIRGRRYDEWLKDLEDVEYSAGEVAFKNTSMFRGEPIQDEMLESFGDVVYAERGFDFVNIYSRSFDLGGEGLRFLREYFGVADINVINPDDLRGLLLGLRGGDRYIYKGVLQDIDFDDRKIKILGKKDAEVIEFGNIRLDDDRREVFVRVP
ncbi:Clp1/GlmU family protein [Geoglobus sp.]